MVQVPKPVLKAAELDLDLLSIPFNTDTHWYVITGAPCCGKTTLIDQLTNLGYRTIPETARQYIQKATSDGQGSHPIHSDPAALQRKLKDLQLKVEKELPASEILFLDSALPSSLAWYRVYGLDPNDFLAECFQHRYARVFILEPLPFQGDKERVDEMAGITNFLDHWQTRDYIAMGYQIVRVPVLPPDMRLKFLLKKLPSL